MVTCMDACFNIYILRACTEKKTIVNDWDVKLFILQ